MCEAYKAYFGMPVGDQDKQWAPHFTCEHCKKTLEVPHCPELPVPTPPDRATPPSEESSRSDTQEDVEDHDFSSCADEERKPYYPNQKDLNDLIRDLGLTKSNAELLTSRLKQWNLLDESVFRVVKHSTCLIIRKRDNESESQQNLSSLEQSEEGALSPLNVGGTV
ncbi:hypothetical protein MHYP_G00336070 [Metynnis hypsauchen]